MERMRFRPMDPKLVMQALEDQEDLLTPGTRVVIGGQRGPQADCPSCGGKMVSQVDEELRMRVMRCVTCGYCVSEETGVVLATGKPNAGREIDFRMITRPSPPEDGQR